MQDKTNVMRILDQHKIDYAIHDYTNSEVISGKDVAAYFNENEEKVYFMPLEGTMHVSCSSETIQPTFDMSVPVEATTQNLASFIDMEMEE